MNTYEWTLAARWNCKDDDPVCTQRLTAKENLSEGSKNCKPIPDTTSAEGYFCSTAPVEGTHTRKYPGQEHYVFCYTDTVIVDLRYSALPCVNSYTTGGEKSVTAASLFNGVADAVRTIVISELGLSDLDKYR